MINLCQKCIEKQPVFTYSACGPLSKNKKRIQKFKERGYISYICKNELDKACFQNDMAYGDFKYLARIRVSDKVLRDKAFNIAKHHKYDGYQRGLGSMVYNCFDKKSKGSGVNTHANDKIKQNHHSSDLATHQLPEELHKPIIRKLRKKPVYSRSIDHILGADLADMQLISEFHKGFRFSLCVIDIFSKYSWVVPLRDKKSVSNC